MLFFSLARHFQGLVDILRNFWLKGIFWTFELYFAFYISSEILKFEKFLVKKWKRNIIDSRWLEKKKSENVIFCFIYLFLKVFLTGGGNNATFNCFFTKTDEHFIFQIQHFPILISPISHLFRHSPTKLGNIITTNIWKNIYSRKGGKKSLTVYCLLHLKAFIIQNVTCARVSSSVKLLLSF